MWRDLRLFKKEVNVYIMLVMRAKQHLGERLQKEYAPNIEKSH